MTKKDEKKHKTFLEEKLEAELEAESALEEAGDESDLPEAELLDEAAEAQEQAAAADTEQLIKERDSYQDQLLRARAEFDNYRKRVARDNERMRKMAAESLIRDLLPVVDHLELALQHADDPSGGFAQGVEMVLKQFRDVLLRQGLEPIASVGEPFDPNVHEAMMQRESGDVAADMVIEEFQRGYRLGDLVLRPSKVVVSSGPGPVEATPEEAGAQ